MSAALLLLCVNAAPDVAPADPLPDLQRLPLPAVVEAQLAWSKAHVAHIDGRIVREAGTWRYRDLLEWRAEAVTRAAPWQLLSQVQQGRLWNGRWACDMTLAQRREGLRALKVMLGGPDYYRGVLPSIVPDARWFSER